MFQTDFDNSRYNFMAPVDVARRDGNGAEIGKWTIGDGALSAGLGNMRHFAARNGGQYVVRFPNRSLPRWFSTTITNAFRSGDSFLLAVSFDGTANVGGYFVSGFEHDREKFQNVSATDTRRQFIRTFSAATSAAEVATSSGDKYWQDQANNLVWVKVQGGLAYPNTNLVPNSDEDLYRNASIVLFSR